MKNEKPKERILESVSQLFCKQGFNSTGINQIVKHSKVAKASFYDHFKSKDALALEYLHQRHISWFNGLNDFIKNAITAKEKVIGSFEYLKVMNEKEDFSGCVFLNMLSELKFNNEDAHKIIKNHKQDLMIFFERIINDNKKSFLIYMLFESCLVESQVYRSQEVISKTIENLKTDLL